MKISEIVNLVEQLSQALVMADPSDPDTFADLPERFGDLAAVIMEMGKDDEAAACRSAIAVAAQVTCGELDWNVGLEYLGKTLNALQACLNDECGPDEAGFPEAPDEEPVAVDVEQAVPDDTPTEIEPAAEAETEAQPEAEESLSDGAGLVDDGIMSEFLARQSDILLDVEKMLLAMDEDPAAGDIESLLRFFHTLKGESALLGLGDVSDLCHATEDMMQREDPSTCVDRLLDVKDWFITTFNHLSEDGPPPAPLAEMLERLNETPADAVEAEEPVESAEPLETPAPIDDPGVDAEPEPASPAESRGAEVAVVQYEVVDYTSKNVLEGDVELVGEFVEEAVEHLDASEAHLLTIESDPHDSEALNAVFRGFHTIKGLAGFVELDHVQDLAHKAENLLDMARRDEIELIGNNMDLVFESVDVMKRLIMTVAAALGRDGLLSEEADLPELMGRLVAVTSNEEAPAAAAAAPAPAPEPETAAAPPAKASGFIPLSNMKPRNKPAAAPEAQAQPAPTPAAKPAAAKPAPESAKGTAPAGAGGGGKAKSPIKMKEAVRVDAERLDRLIETIGELVIAESMVTQSEELSDSNLSVKLAKDIDHLDKICRELQEIGMSLRMVPVRPVFQKMARLVRDLSKKQNRKVEFVMNGEDTELDKNVVDKIGDPLVHMVRNAVDHGIEPDVADRIAAGKPEQGKVELSAFHKGGNICIEIQDDGRGLNKEAILEKAMTRGLIREGEKLGDREIFNMIFEPGFSTAAKVTDVSGRGVGMDVVRRNIEELRGTCDINSEAGKGSVFSIKLPLTLAIIEGMVIMVGQEHYIIPTLSVVRLIRPQKKDINYVFDRGEMLSFEGEHLPLFRLSGLFEVADAKTDPDNAMVVVVEDEGKKIGLMADELLGQQSIVIKSLGESVQGTDGVAGGAIMSNGNVALILDIAGLVRVAHAMDTTRQNEELIAAVEDDSPALPSSCVEMPVDAEVEPVVTEV